MGENNKKPKKNPRYVLCVFVVQIATLLSSLEGEVE